MEGLRILGKENMHTDYVYNPKQLQSENNFFFNKSLDMRLTFKKINCISSHREEVGDEKERTEYRYVNTPTKSTYGVCALF